MQMLIETLPSYKLGTSPTKEPMHRHLWMAAAAALIALPGYAQNPPTFTATLATQGQSAYAQNCAGCHGGSLDDGEFAPPLKGTAFTAQWGGKNVSELFEYINTKMPPSNAGALGDTTYSQITAFVLQSNGLPLDSAKIPGGANGRPSAPAASGPGGGLSPYATLIPAPPKPDPLEKLTPVTDALLQNPPASEWLTWRRTYDDQGFSPLKQINKSNVGELRSAWSWSLFPGANEATPLVHDGVIFVHSSGDHVQALDAVTGDLLWQYSRQLPKPKQGFLNLVKRDIAIYGNRIFLDTSDLHVVALDMKTGEVAWDHEILDRDKNPRVMMTGGPLTAKGKVFVGTVGQAPGGNMIVALDANTGKEAWRFYTIARPGEPGGNTWNGLPLDKRNGASVWTAGSYDPALNLVFFGAAQTYDTGPLVHPSKEPGINNDALYTDTTLAFDPDSGKLVWHFQHMPNDQWDLDWAFERQLVNLPVKGETKRVIVTAGKEAIYDVLDAANGKYDFSMDLGIQNVVTAIDPVTGAKTINQQVVVGDGETKTVCPHAGGAKSWIPGSLNPETKILYVPLVESCMDLIPVAAGERGGLSSGVRFTIRPRLDSDGKYGRFEAINLETRKVVWTDRQRAPQTTGALATAGGIVFDGSLDRYIRAYDESNGKVLWETRLNDVPSSCPITYSVNGKQYVAVVVGNGGAHAATWPPLVPEIKNPSGGGAQLWVFELPAK
ncbi:MAG TPA: PQQ-binding-like beta-propeller repeat protein [Bryobacteraceae bacterium]|nr:PQQ-binding-like beta-propeller repeat protein [Bryobacteraceae bacterium]